MLIFYLVHETEDVVSRGPDVVENVDEIRLGGEALEKLLVHHQECMPRIRKSGAFAKKTQSVIRTSIIEIKSFFSKLCVHEKDAL